MKTLVDRLPAALTRRLPSLPPATPRNLWLLLAATVAVQSLAVFTTSQLSNNAVFALLIWGGAVICMEDQLETLTPRPSLASLLLGTVLLLWVLARTAVILHWDGLLFALAPLAGLALALLCQPPARLMRFRDSFLCLMLLPAYALLMRILPETALSLATARISGFWLGILGLEVAVDGRQVMLPTGGVTVLGACNGLDMIAQVFCVALIFLLAFPIRSRCSLLLILIGAPLIGLLSNTIRIAILAVVASNGQGHGGALFDFFHKDAGSLVFSGVAVLALGSFYLRLLERELPPLTGSSDQ
jgi:cyanoexosortase A